MTSNPIKIHNDNARHWSFLYLNIVGNICIASLILNIPNFLSVNYNFPPVVFYSILSFLCFLSITIHGNKFRIILNQPFLVWSIFVIIIYYIYLLISYIKYSERVSSTIAIDLMIILAALLPAASLTLMDRSVRHTGLAVAAFLLPALIVLDFVRPGLLYPLGTEGAVLGRGRQPSSIQTALERRHCWPRFSWLPYCHRAGGLSFWLFPASVFWQRFQERQCSAGGLCF